MIHYVFFGCSCLVYTSDPNVHPQTVWSEQLKRGVNFSELKDMEYSKTQIEVVHRLLQSAFSMFLCVPKIILIPTLTSS